MWYLLSFVAYAAGAILFSSIVCTTDEICLFKNAIGWLDAVLFPLSMLIIWVFTWGLLCQLFRLEIKKGEPVVGAKALLSYVLSLACSYLYPYVMIGG